MHCSHPIFPYYSNFANCSNNIVYSQRIQFRIMHFSDLSRSHSHEQFLVSPRLSWPWHFWRSQTHYSWSNPRFGLICYFLMSRFKLCVLSRNPKRMLLCSSQCILSGYTISVSPVNDEANFLCVIKVVSATFLSSLSLIAIMWRSILSWSEFLTSCQIFSLFIRLFTCVSMDTWLLVLCNRFIICSYDYSPWCSNYPWLGSWERFQVDLYILLTCPGHSLSICLFSGTTKCSRFILYFLCCSPGISHLSKEPWFLSVESGLKVQIWAQGCSLLLERWSLRHPQGALRYIDCCAGSLLSVEE